MVTVAVAGGTGGIGRTIVEELVRQGKHQVLILSRKVWIEPFMAQSVTKPCLEQQVTRSRVCASN
jgi:NAD(P)-dependent dehydrogenase (short-subunit alcohol dehydrogenase family)